MSTKHVVQAFWGSNFELETNDTSQAQRSVLSKRAVITEWLMYAGNVQVVQWLALLTR